MGSQVWVVATLLVSIVLIVLTIVKLKFHPFLALLLAVGGRDYGPGRPDLRHYAVC